MSGQRKTQYEVLTDWTSDVAVCGKCGWFAELNDCFFLQKYSDNLIDFGICRRGPWSAGVKNAINKCTNACPAYQAIDMRNIER